MRPEASSWTTSILPRPMTVPSAMVDGGAAVARRISANDARPPARNIRRRINIDMAPSLGFLGPARFDGRRRRTLALPPRLQNSPRACRRTILRKRTRWHGGHDEGMASRDGRALLHCLDYSGRGAGADLSVEDDHDCGAGAAGRR